MFKALLAATLLSAASFAAHAQAPYPSRPITMIYPYPAGGAGDTTARALAEQMSKRLGQPIIVDNRPGASGIIGTSAGARANPDGYTILITLAQSVLNNQFLFKKLPYNPGKDFSFITEVCSASLLLTANPSIPAKTVPELLAWGKSHRINYGSWGVGSYGHLTGAYLADLKRLDLVHVAYKGEAPMVQDLIGGQINVAFASLATVKPFAEGGKLRVLAVAGERRLPGFPEVPTLAEAGLPQPEFKPTGSFMMLVPSATPPEIRNRLEETARASIASKEFQERIAALGLVPIGNSAKDARANYESLYPVQKRLVELSGASLD